MFDLTAKVTSSRILCEGTNRGVLQTSLGGVGRNLAEVLARLGLHPWLITAVGKDDQGQKILQHMRELGMVRWDVKLVTKRDAVILLQYHLL